MQYKSEQLMFIAIGIALLFTCFQNENLRNVNKKLCKTIIDKEFVILELSKAEEEMKRVSTVISGIKFFYPVDIPMITSGIGLRICPLTGKISVHHGFDVISRYTRYIYATRGGVVITHFPPPDNVFDGDNTFGGYIEIVDDWGMAIYGHLSKTFVREEQVVKAGDIIGIAGDTGKAVGVHLHFAYYLNIFKEFK